MKKYFVNFNLEQSRNSFHNQSINLQKIDIQLQDKNDSQENDLNQILSFVYNVQNLNQILHNDYCGKCISHV